jgi:GNAT superfamily N-acetyltransferase
VEAARPAQEADRAACAELLGTALLGAQSMRGGTALAGTASPEQLLDRWMSKDPEAALIVGEFHHVVVGVAAATTFVRHGAEAPSGRMECCFVEEGARGVGVGTALIDAVVAWCVNKGCKDMDAMALPGDRSTKQRLEAAGLTARLLVLNRRLY